MTIRLPKEAKKKKINTSKEMFSVVWDILSKKDKISQDKEHLWLMILDGSKQIKHLELIVLGTVSNVCATPMEIFSVALHRRGVNLAIIHNHPTGNIEPSSADLMLTLQLRKVGLICGIPIVDHLIISSEGYFSFKDNELL